VSLYDYRKSQEISAENYPFYALIMSAMRQADTDNVELLKMAFPEVWTELHERYHARGGAITEKEIKAMMDNYKPGLPKNE